MIYHRQWVYPRRRWLGGGSPPALIGMEANTPNPYKIPLPLGDALAIEADLWVDLFRSITVLSEVGAIEPVERLQKGPGTLPSAKRFS